MCDRPAGVFGNCQFSKANNQIKKSISWETAALIKLHRSAFIDTEPGGSQRSSLKASENMGKNTKLLSVEVMFPAICSGIGWKGWIINQKGEMHDSPGKVFGIDLFCQWINVQTKRICKIFCSSYLHIQSHSLCLEMGFCFYWVIPSSAFEEAASEEKHLDETSWKPTLNPISWLRAVWSRGGGLCLVRSPL